jgi:uncharacterized membrane protein YjfL (UPF0719 family)
MADLMWIAYSAGYLVFAVIFLLIGKKFFDLLTPYSVNIQLTHKDNVAVGVLLVGFLLGLACIICGVFAGDGAEEPSLAVFLNELIEVGLYGLLGMVLLFGAGIINDKVVLHKFSNQTEIVESGNVAVAVIMAATYVGSALMIAGGIQGCIGVSSMLISFGVGQIALTLFAGLYQLITRYDDQKELGEKQNVAAALAYGGNLVAYGLILMKGLSMDPSQAEVWTWQDRLINAGYYAVVGGVLLILTRIINDRLFLPKAKLSQEIVEDRNLNAGLMAAALALSMGAAMVFCL